MVKGFLSLNEVPFEALSLVEERHRQEHAKLGSQRAPTVVVGDEVISGFEPMELFDALKRASLLAPDAEPRVQAEPESQLDLRAPLSEALLVSAFQGDGLNLVNASTGQPLGPTLETSTVWSAGRPISVATSPHAGSIAVVNHEGGSVTFLSLADAGYLKGTWQRSTLPTGDFPLYVVAHPGRPWFYVSNLESQSLTVFDATRGDYAFGDQRSSTFEVPGPPNTIVLDAERDVLYVRLRQGAIAMLDATTLAPSRGDFASSMFEVGTGRDLALSADGTVLLVPESLASPDGLGLYDAHAGGPLFGERSRSVLDTAPIPFAIAAHPSRDIAYVSCFGTRVVELRQSRTGAYLRGSAQASSTAVGAGARAMLVDPRSETLFVACFDENAVIMLDARSGEYRRGDLASSSIPVGAGPRGMALTIEAS